MEISQCDVARRPDNGVSMKLGYSPIDIRTPYEVINDENNEMNWPKPIPGFSYLKMGCNFEFT